MLFKIPEEFLVYLESDPIPAFGHHIYRHWPRESLAALLRHKFIKLSGPIDEMPCPGCGEFLVLHWGEIGKKRKSFIHCPDDGRYFPNDKELEGYSVDMDAIVKLVSDELKLGAPKALVSGRFWEWGDLEGPGRTFLLRGSNWPVSVGSLKNETGICLGLGVSHSTPKGMPKDICFVALSREFHSKAGKIGIDTRHIFDQTKNFLSETKNKSGLVKTPALNQTQHCDAWGIGIPANVFRKDRPFRNLWDSHKTPNKTASLPLMLVAELLLKYWSHSGQANRAPKDEKQVWGLYVKAGFAKESQSLSV